jgi:hypothetical protein
VLLGVRGIILLQNHHHENVITQLLFVRDGVCRCCCDLRFLSDLYAAATLQFVKKNSMNADSEELVSSLLVSSSSLQSRQPPPPPPPTDIIIPDVIKDVTGCSSTITLQHGTLRCLSGMARLTTVALFRSLYDDGGSFAVFG